MVANPSGCLPEFLAHDFAEELLKGRILMLRVCAEGIIEHSLVVPTALGFRLGLEPLHKITIQPDRDSCLVSGWGHDRSAACLAEVIIRFHTVVLGSSNTLKVSAKDTPCLVSFCLALLLSHSNMMLVYASAYVRVNHSFLANDCPNRTLGVAVCCPARCRIAMMFL